MTQYEVLAQNFQDRIPRDLRKTVAAYYTIPAAAELLAYLAVSRVQDKVVDLAVGGGALLMSAHRRKRDLLMKESRVDHHSLTRNCNALLDDLTGMDIMPSAVQLAASNLELLEFSVDPEMLRLTVCDSTTLSPGQSVRSISNHNFHLRMADVVMINPPFTRQERIPPDYKKRLRESFSDYPGLVNGKLGLHGYFILLTDRFVKPGGRLAMVLPASVLRLISMKAVRRMLLDKYCLEFLVTASRFAAFSEDAQFREIILIAQKNDGTTNEQSDVVIVRLSDLPSTLEGSRNLARRLIEFRHSSETRIDSPAVKAYRISRARVAHMTDNLLPLVSGSDYGIEIWKTFLERTKGKLVTLRDYLESSKASFNEGIRFRKAMFQRDNSIDHFFIAREHENNPARNGFWLLEEQTPEHLVAKQRSSGALLEVPLSSVRPALRRISGMSTMDVTRSLDYVLIEPENEDSLFLTRWNSYVNKRTGNLALARRLDVSATGSKLFAFYSQKPMVPGSVLWSLDLPDRDAKILTAWFNSTINILQSLVYRSETRGAFIELGGYILKEFEIIDPAVVNDGLVDVFDELKDLELPSLHDQLCLTTEARIRLDRAIFHSLGMSEEETDRMIRHLYSVLAEEIEGLESLMRGEAVSSKVG